MLDLGSPTPKAETDSYSPKSLSIAKLEWALKMSALVVGTLYVTGLIVTSLKLAQVGIVSTDFAKPIYVLTGVWAFFPVLLATGIWFGYRRTVAHFSTKRQITAIALLSAVLVVGGAYASMDIIKVSLGPMGFGPAFIQLVFMLTFQALVLIFVSHNLVSERTVARDLFHAADLSCFIFLLIYHLTLFSLILYAQIPAGLGGGGIRYLALVVDDLNIRQAITGSRDGQAPILTPVLAETSSSFVLPGPKSNFEEYSVNPVLLSTRPWESKAVFERNVVVVPKSGVVVATVIGIKPQLQSTNTHSATPKPVSAKAPSPTTEPTASGSNTPTPKSPEAKTPDQPGSPGPLPPVASPAPAT